ncbi:RAD52 motif-containing protein 1-like [Phoca vitulina]|uniref:RAD52 motif-containing protein 1-like n=1 Tax=Phoca vitulina TaxID=9720 RepID=UPI001395FE15|nr:RAD52 motif-containing protein 1-like [Phoca vitulina]
MAEVVSFAVPTESDKTLLVWELSSGPTAEALHHSLSTVFSQFGLVYSIRVFPNAAVARPGFYAIIKFYSARDAHRAQMACHEKHLFQNSPVKVGPNRKFLTPLGRSAEFRSNRLAFVQHSALQNAFRCIATSILRFPWVFVCFLLFRRRNSN